MSKDVLVTGGAGFIGGKLAAALVADGWSVDVVDNLSSGHERNVPPEATFVEADLRRPEALDLLPRRRYDAILHLAGQCSGERSFEIPLYDLEANAGSTLLLAEWALANGTPALVHASSMGVYGEVDGRTVAETEQAQPISYYGASKLAAERALAVARTRGLRACSLRMFTVYGPGQDLSNMKQGMVSIYLSYLLRGEPVTVKGSLDRMRDFVHVDDVVRAWQAALERGADGIFNVSCGRGTTVRTLLSELADACGADTYSVEEADGTPGDQSGIAGDAAAIRETLGWRAEIELRQGLRDMVASYAAAAQ